MQQFPVSDSNWWTGGELNTGFNEKLHILTLLTGKPVFELTPDMPALSGNQNIGRAIAEGNTMWVHYLAPWVELTMTFEGDSRVAYLEKRLLDKGEVKCRLGHHVSAYSDVTWQDCAYLPQKLSTVDAVITNSIVLLGMQFSIRSMEYQMYNEYELVYQTPKEAFFSLNTNCSLVTVFGHFSVL
ncbi:hypothetical protein SPFM8_00105 [Salmonella phage SPFM8]|nr:hypothetical protein SPFM8_00105 [Salmonella phage SPFM8]